MKLWTKFVIYISALIVTLVSIMLLFIVQSNTYSSAYQEILYNVYLLNEAYNTLNATEEELEAYLTNQRKASNESFNKKFDELYSSVNSMPISFSTREEQFAYQNIRGMLITLNLQIDQCLKASRGRDPEGAKEYFEQSLQTMGQMERTIDYLVLKYMSASHELYDFIERDMKKAQKFSILLIFAISAFSLIFTISFVKQMTEEIRIYIGQVNEKAEIEKELRDAELKMLQAQINPHFLFNTLNCIAQNAMLENADKTYELLLCASDMLRYNLQQIDKPVKIREELENLKRYVHIQNERYGEKIKFLLERVDEGVQDLLIPCLTLQPIVENSIIHGFENSGRQGVITVCGVIRGEVVELTITDNGEGMDAATLEKIRNSEEGGAKGHSTGIGIKNVIYRLRLFYGEDVFMMESEKGKGTRTILRIPLERARD